MQHSHPHRAALSDIRGRSAVARLDGLALTEGQRIAYVFDFGCEQRVALELRRSGPAAGRMLARYTARGFRSTAR